MKFILPERYLIYLIPIIAFLSAFYSHVNGQVSYGGKPYPYDVKKTVTEVVKMPSFDYDQVLRQMESDNILDGKKPLPVGYNYEVDLNPLNSGKWTEMPDGTKVWRIEIMSESAFGIGIFFNEFVLERGARIFLYEPSQNEIRGSFDQRSNKDSENFPVSFIPGEKIVVELQVSAEMEDYGRLNIGTVTHVYVDIFGGSDLKDGRFGRSAWCNVDINCPEGDAWQDVKRAVCRIIFSSGATSILCTGTLINTTVSDAVPYLYTANHCINRSSEAQSAVFYFEYESPECNGLDGSVNKTIAGSSIKATSDSLDFSLLLLSEDIPEAYNPYFAGWTLTANPAPSSLSIHHPQGDVKKIAVSNTPLTSQYQTINPPSWLATSTPNGFWRVTQWDHGTTEGGSSGSPLLNNHGMIVGNLTGGDATCAVPINDYYSKFHLAWDYYSPYSKRLKPWLDENQTGRTAVFGYDPFFIPDPTSTILDIIANSPEHNILGSAIISSGLFETLSGSGPFTFFAPTDEAFNKLLPGTLDLLMSDKTGKLAEIIKNHIVNANILSPGLSDGSLLNALSGRRIQVTNNESGLYYDYSQINAPDKQAVNGVVHFTDAVILSADETNDPFIIFPNPAVEDFWIISAEGSMNGARLKLYTMNGSVLAEYTITDEKLGRVNVHNFPSGLYILEITHEQKVFLKKLILAKPNR